MVDEFHEHRDRAILDRIMAADRLMAAGAQRAYTLPANVQRAQRVLAGAMVRLVAASSATGRCPPVSTDVILLGNPRMTVCRRPEFPPLSTR